MKDFKLTPLHQGYPEMEQSRAERIISDYREGVRDLDIKAFRVGYEMCLIDFGYKIVPARTEEEIV
ncbi:hypothetical protein P9257_05260 [Bacillus velezensis]|uniref:hypothetical protein n=1 Tax=Bacillus velezensis TaxID=492670 RepID=UPI002E1EEBFC|nr:hypothetical protein [Bacillus velezensis]